MATTRLERAYFGGDLNENYQAVTEDSEVRGDFPRKVHLIHSSRCHEGEKR
jgi:hypothetical protein